MVILGGLSLWLRDYIHNRPISWVPYSATELERNLREGHVVLVNFHADWDLTSLHNERNALETQKVREFIRSHGVVAMSADFTDESPEVEAGLKAIDRRSIPWIAIHSPASKHDPILLGDDQTEKNVLAALQRAAGRP